jgi:glycine hydroxymethyltransferase
LTGAAASLFESEAFRRASRHNLVGWLRSSPTVHTNLPDDVRGELTKVRSLLDQHDEWRSATLNLIASENVLSPAARSVLDSDLLHRYAEGHPGGRYYEGTKFVDEIERMATAACKRVFRCGWADVRPISGTVSNEAVFSRLVPRGATVIAHKVATGGHISHDRMGSLGKRTDAILPWPTQADGHRIDVAAAKDLIAKERPAVAVMGRSLFLFPEPVAELRDVARESGTRIVFDGAHVLGLVAAGCFQDPLAEGADVMTGSTHKTFFGPQRGVVLAVGADEAIRTAVDRGVFPGSSSNHHLFSLPSLLVATLETETFGPAYGRAVVENARALAASLFRRGISVAFPDAGFTASHQVVIDVHAQGGGKAVAAALAEQDVICNMNLLPGEPGKAAMNPRGIRLGVQEMTRVGMGTAEMDAIGAILADAILRGRAVAPDVRRLRSRFTDVHYGFSADDLRAVVGATRT